MTQLYMPKVVPQKVAKAIRKDAQISPKVAIEIAAFLRGKKLDVAMRSLDRVLEMKEAIPYRRFTNAIGHRKGPMASGRYPQKASTEFLKILKNAKANASTNGLSGDLIISHVAANRAAEPMRGRAKFRHQTKRAHIEVFLTEAPAEKKKVKKEKAAAKPAAQD